MDTQLCSRLLQCVYQETGGRLDEPVAMSLLGEQLGLSENKIHDIAIDLQKQGMVKIMPGRVVRIQRARVRTSNSNFGFAVHS